MADFAAQSCGSGPRAWPTRTQGLRVLRHALAAAMAAALGLDAYVQLSVAWSRRTAARSMMAGAITEARRCSRRPRLDRLRRVWSGRRLLAAGTAAALGIDAYVHLTTAGSYVLNGGALVNEGNAFVAEALVAAAAALYVLRRPATLGWLVSLAVAVTALAAVLLSRYVHIGAVGPVPDFYEPTWNVPGKVLATVAEAGAAAGSLAGLMLARRAHSYSRGGLQP